MNFASIAFLDPFELIGSLRQRMGLFGPSAGGGLRSLPVRGPRANADDPDDDLGFVLYKDAGKWVELKNTLGRIKRIGDQGGGIEFGRIALELLPPGVCLPWAFEDSTYNARFNRAYLALRTNPGVTLFSGNESWSPIIGLLTVANRRVRHSAVNLGEHPAIWLAVDFRRKDDANGKD